MGHYGPNQKGRNVTALKFIGLLILGKITSSTFVVGKDKFKAIGRSMLTILCKQK